MKRALVKEWVATLQLVCPYCGAIQTESTPLHIIHDPPDYWTCEECKKVMKVNAD